MIQSQESFEELTQSLRSMIDAFQQSAASAINKHVTCRNWLNGYYIVHYEQNGSDRAKYGEKLLQKLSEWLNMKGYSYRDLRLYRQFFLVYRSMLPAIGGYILSNSSNWQSTIANLGFAGIQENGIWQSLIAKLESPEKQIVEIEQSPIAKSDASLLVPPLGILLCTAVGKEMVEFTTSGIDEHLFVSEYMLRLPSEEELKAWLINELKQLR